MHTLPISEKEISQWTKAPVFSPVLCASLDYLGVDKTEFIDFYKDCFANMPWDLYDVKRRQWELLSTKARANKEAVFKDYYLNPKASLHSFTQHFNIYQKTKDKLAAVQPWRRRSVCSFELALGPKISIKRVYPEGFEQGTGTSDIRSLPRVFEETDGALVEDERFYDLMRKIATYAQSVTPHIAIKAIRMTAHFMSVKARKGVPGNNSPEGAHEDGADFIVSALVVNRDHILGGKSQVFEKLANGKMVNIFERELQPGEFLFQADTGEEKHYGNDLWHYVTPFYVEEGVSEAWRDIIGFDIVIAAPKI